MNSKYFQDEDKLHGEEPSIAVSLFECACSREQSRRSVYGLIWVSCIVSVAGPACYPFICQANLFVRRKEWGKKKKSSHMSMVK